MRLKALLAAAIVSSVGFAAGQAPAEIAVGVVVSATGPAASLGIPERNTVTLMPATIGGVRVRYIVLDDASDTTTAVRHARKLVTEDRVDVVIGPSITSNALAMTDVAAESRTPMIALAAAASIVSPVDDRRRWVFKTPQNDAQMSAVIVDHMMRNGVRTVALISFSDAYGDNWYEQFRPIAEARGLRILANTRFGRTDTSVIGQVLKVMATRPDAVLVVGAGTPAALPQKTLEERGYAGRYYQTHGVANNDFLRVCGRDCEGTFLPAGPVLVAVELPAGPVKTAALDYIARYEKQYGAGSVSTFGAHAWDASLLLGAAVPEALKRATPGTAGFRAALRDALEGVRDLPASHGVYSMSPTDHLGLDDRSRVMVQIRNGTWRLAE